MNQGIEALRAFYEAIDADLAGWIEENRAYLAKASALARKRMIQSRAEDYSLRLEIRS